MIPCHILSPGGNTTALIDAACTESELRVASSSLRATHPEVEQVGSIDLALSDPQLKMAGGELCINATRSAALLWSKRHSKETFAIEVSGFVGKISATVKGEYVELEIPDTVIIEKANVPEGVLIDLQGIRFVVVRDVINQEVRDELMKKYSDTVPAMGVLFVREEGEAIVIDPWIRVQSTGVYINETACGSGSIAACIATGKSSGQFRVMQPSGAIYDVTLMPHDHVVRIGGTVQYIQETEITL